MATGVVASTTTYTADSSVDSSKTGGVFIIEATGLAVLVGRSGSDEVGTVNGRLWQAGGR